MPCSPALQLHLRIFPLPACPTTASSPPSLRTLLRRPAPPDCSPQVAVIKSGARKGEVVIRVSEKYFRPAEVDLLLGDPTKAVTKLGWNPSRTPLRVLCQVGPGCLWVCCAHRLVMRSV